MNKLLILLITVLLWIVPSIAPAQQEHDHEHEVETLQPATADHENSHDEDGHEDHDDGLVVELTPEAMNMAGITLATVTRGSIGSVIDLPGEVGFDEDNLVHVAPRFAGIARQARYRVGDYVNKGDVVAVIESNESMSSYSIKAAISGWIIQRHVSPGEFVSEENSIYIIADLSHVWVNLAVYAKDAGIIKPGQEVHIRAIGSDTHAEGTIDYVTPILDIDTRSITARVVLPNPANMWRPGMFVHAQVVTTSGEARLLVDRTAVQMLDEKNVVFVSDGPGRFRPVEVITGDANAHQITLLAGLEEGTEYVADGAFELKAKIVTSSLGGHAGHGH